MPTRSRSFLVRNMGVRMRLLVRRVARAWARVERRVVEYITKTTPRRRASRVVGIVLFACMSVGLMGTNECESCRLVLRAAFGAILGDYFYYAIENSFDDGDVRGVAHPNFTGTDGSQTGVASYGTASSNISVLLGNADGTFQSPVTYAVGGSQYTVAAVIDDVNNDGKLDTTGGHCCRSCHPS